MKLTTLMFFIALFQVSAISYSQQTRLNLKFENETLESVFSKIEENSEFSIFYKDELIRNSKEINGEFKDALIFDILDQVLKSENLSYSIKDKLIIIVGKEDHPDEMGAVQQQKSVSGKVTDTSGATLPGVSVVIKGSTNGTITDANGNYKLTNVPLNAILQFSFIGMKKEEVVVGEKTAINLTLNEETVAMDEVVSIGYGTIKKSDLTGAITAIKSEDLSTAATTNVSMMLQGKAAGVMVSQESAQPGGGIKVLIRGQSSTNANSQPLYVLDGFPISNDQIEENYGVSYSSGSRNPLNTINPNDIESIEILKDASACAIYGSRAANGVVLITTKRGKNGIKMSYNGRYTVQKITSYFDVLNASEFMTMYNTHLKQYWDLNTDGEPYGTKPSTFKPKYSEEQIANAGEGTNWFNEVTRPGLINDQNFSVSGGTDKTKFYSSFNYFDQKGVVINSAFKRFSGRLNVDQEITSKIKMGVNVTASQIENNNAALGGSYWEQSGIIASALGFPPIYPVYNDSTKQYSENDLYSSNPNPVSFKDIIDVTIDKRMLVSSYIDVILLKDLNFKTNVGVDNVSSTRNAYLPKTFKYGEAVGGKATRAINGSTNYLVDYVLSYSKLISNKHSINALAGYSFQKFQREGLYAQRTNFSTDAFTFNSLEAGSDVASVRSSRSESKIASYYSRINYSYSSKYLATLTLRRDGSDIFGQNNKWGYFPSLALGWNIAKEGFMSSIDQVNDLKIRASIGQTGNSNIGGNAYARYAPTGSARYQFGNVINSGIIRTQDANPNLKWETTTEYNYGVDFGLLNNRITGSLEYYNKTISDLLYIQEQPVFMPVGQATMNIGKTQSKGVELSINTHILTGKLKWDFNLNVSKYTDKWKERAPEAIKNLDPNFAVDDYLRPFYYYEADHIMQLDETAPYGLKFVPGNLIVKDLDSWKVDEAGKLILDSNGRKIKTGIPDGKLDDADKKFLGTSDPALIFGFGNNFTYKGFELSFFFNGMLDYMVRNENYDFYTQNTEFIYGGFNRSKEFMDTWTPENPNGKIPAKPQNHYQIGSEALSYQNVSYIRLNNLTLGYNIPAKILGTSVKLYFSGSNLFTITNLQGMDPETITYNAGSQYDTRGSGFGAYPSQKSYTFGLSVNY